MCALYCVVQSIVLLHDIMTRPFSSSLSFAQRRVLDAVVRRERLRQPNFVSDLVSDLGLRAESSLAPTLKRMERLGVVEIQGGGVKGRQRLVVSTEEGRLLCSGAHSKITAFPQAAPSLLLLPILGAIPAGPLEEVIAGEIKLLGVKNAALISALTVRKFMKNSDNYSYLTELPVSSLTEEKRERLVTEAALKRKELADLEGKTIGQLWSEDLNALALAIERSVASQVQPVATPKVTKKRSAKK